jgi:hypothetical protein
MTIVAGTHPIKGVAFKFGYTDQNNTPYVAVVVEITDGPSKGETLSRSFFLTEKAFANTELSLRAMGWDGSDLTSLDGFGTTECFGVFAMEASYKDPTKSFMNLKFVNATAEGGGKGGGLNVTKEMAPGDLNDLAVRFGKKSAKKKDVPF